MPNFNTTTKIFRGAVSAAEVSTTAGTLSREINDYLKTVDDEKFVSMTSAYDGAHMLTVVVVTQD